MGGAIGHGPGGVTATAPPKQIEHPGLDLADRGACRHGRIPCHRRQSADDTENPADGHFRVACTGDL